MKKENSKEYSVNINNGKKYLIPSTLDDRENINEFLKRNENKKVIVVQGLGFVGAVMSLVCANSDVKDYAVIGIDLPTKSSYWKIKSINEGEFPIISSDSQVETFYQNTRNKGNFLATFDPYVYSLADVIIVDINLDVQKETDENNELKDFSVDLTTFKKAIISIGENCKEDILVLVETTVPVGTCANIVKPVLSNEFKKRDLNSDKLKIGHSYERVMPGPDYIESIKNFYRVFSGIDTKSAVAVENFLKTIISTDKYPLTQLKSTNATEMAKVLENSYRAMNIAFMVEWSRFAEESKVDLYEVVDAIRMRPTHKNLMYPGIGVGGYCLTKDPLLASWSKTDLINGVGGLTQSEIGVKINDQMPLRAYEFLVKHYNGNIKDKSIILLGVSYRSDVGDTRFTPVELFYDQLIKAGGSIRLHDPYVDVWEEKNLKIEKNIYSLIESRPDIIVFTTSHKEYNGNQRLIESLLKIERTYIVDTIGVLSSSEIDLLRKKHMIKVIGRGDI